MFDDSTSPIELSYHGTRFCPACHNILHPHKASANNLEFNCKNCGKQEIDFTDRTFDECLLYSKEMDQTEEEGEGIVDKEYAMDPTMPRVKTVCENCDYEEAVYFLLPEKEQMRMKVILLCARVESGKAVCGNSWELPEDVML